VLDIVEYLVASEHQLGNMVSVTNRLISEGRQPFGGLQVVVPVVDDGPAPFYSQAMVKYAK
jgi:hypothetical protein